MRTVNTSVSLCYIRSADLLKSAQRNQETRHNKNFRNDCFLFAVIEFFFFFTIKHLCKLAVGLNPTFGLLDPSTPAGVYSSFLRGIHSVILRLRLTGFPLHSLKQ